MIELIPLVLYLPALGAIINAFAGRKSVSRIVGPAVVGLAFLIALVVLAGLLALPPDQRSRDVLMWTWMPGRGLDIQIAARVDPLSLLMTLVVTGVGFLIHVYSTGYMADDERYARFFFYLNLFITAMLALVLGNNYLMMFLGWEGVGLCSYLLIGFWFYKPEAANAAKKAFVVNRIGDFAFTIGVLWLFAIFGTSDYNVIFGKAHEVFKPGDTTITWITLLLFIGATGKSAQLPLFVWLPDAMEGPTPVSALIHAATMVTAGVYMVVRSHALFELAPLTMSVVASVGALTALFAATIALVHTDLKRVLAYSTISQLGYMFMAAGVGAWPAAMFHLTTHAFFKALMFLGAGSVMHGLHGETNIFKMGGLRKFMPVTAATFVFGWLAISGIPPLAGFFSKDEILAQTFNAGYPALWALGTLTAALTAFYISRITILAFFGRQRFGRDVHPHESPPSMTAPLAALAFLSLVGGMALGLPLGEGSLINQFLAPVFTESHVPVEAATGNADLLTSISVAMGVLGIGVAWVLYVARWIPASFVSRVFKPFYILFSRKYFVDEIYHALVVVPAVWTAEFLFKAVDHAMIDGVAIGGAVEVMTLWSRALRWTQSGYVRSYAFLTLLGAVAMVLFFLFRL
ncbi:MAG: NADH-quinone oxidoreductase subunit L [Chloroflexi bacterium]|nr:NADH-quinone oxidoreductase subunit L [Chloroflexota bacterium]